MNPNPNHEYIQSSTPICDIADQLSKRPASADYFRLLRIARALERRSGRLLGTIEQIASNDPETNRQQADVLAIEAITIDQSAVEHLQAEAKAS